MTDGEGRRVADRYLLNRHLGSGGMGRVWLARDEGLRRDVAVKEVLLHGASDGSVADSVSRTLREAHAAAKLRHPGIVTVYDVVDYEDRPWIIMELVDGPSLADHLHDEGPLPVRRAAEIAIEVIEALDAAHEQGVVHRDVKPSNIMLDKKRAVLTDFGIAALDGATVLTLTGQLVGSPEYIAPELIDGHKATPAVDLWAVGITLYHMVIGDTPFRRATTTETFGAISKNEPDPHPGVGPLWPVVQGLLRKKPVERLSAGAAIELMRETLARPATHPPVLPKLPMILASTRPEHTVPEFTARNTRTAVPPMSPLPNDATVRAAGPGGVTPDPGPSRRPRRPRRVRTTARGGVAVAFLVVAVVIMMIVALVNGNHGTGGIALPTSSVPPAAPAITISRGAATTSSNCQDPNCADVDVTMIGFAPNTRYPVTLSSLSNPDVETEYFTTDSHGNAIYNQFDYDVSGETIWISVRTSAGTVSSNKILWWP